MSRDRLGPVKERQRGVGRSKTDECGAEAARLGEKLQGRSGHNAEGALGANEQVLQIVAGVVFSQCPEPVPDLARCQHDFQSEDQVGYGRLVETRVAAGRMWRGPSAVWFRMRQPLVEGEAPAPAERVAVAADSSNGISAVLDFRKYLFVNSDLTINLLRRPEGEWVCLEAQTFFGPNSGGLAESRVYDTQGLVGRATQSLVLRART